MHKVPRLTVMSLRQRMGIAGCEKARREFDERSVCRIVVDTYSELLDDLGLGPYFEFALAAGEVIMSIGIPR